MTPTKRPSNLVRTTIDPRAPEDFDGKTSTDQVVLGPGLKINHYELIRELGRGGMGQVFLARDTRLGRRVAMKFLTSSSPKFTERFVIEARATARCSHENIVVIHDVAELAGLPYMVLEYVEGTSLARLMSGKKLAPGRAIELIVPVVKALARAHAMNIVHRDLKPDNIIVNQSGTVKVLDFGIAKLFAEDDASAPRPRAPTEVVEGRPGGIVGTLPYMSPEQLGSEEVDHRSDLWAVGIILFEMLAGKHPLDPLTQGKLFGAAASDEPMPSLRDAVAGVPDRLVAIVERCLAKKKAARYATAEDLLSDLEPLQPSRTGRHLVPDESPYPGLNAFQESDADRFFGRSQDIAGTVARLREQPLVAVVGPSGAGKSSFVRAGVVPALKATGDAWECIIVRPGRYPLASLANALDQLRSETDSTPDGDLARRLREEPGILGARLRSRARKRRTQIVLFVDQHEELYTLVPNAHERLAFTACLAGAADDASGPLRVIVAMRSDFLDRAAEDRRFVEELARGLVFLQPPNRTGLEQALAQPLEMLGYSFEPGIVDSMLDTLEATPGPLPLLQFTAAKLWETRDRQHRRLTQESYRAIGGVAGALATYADEVIAGFTGNDQKLARAIFQRLVTPERTRAIVDASELRELGGDTDRILGLLVASRLVVVHSTAVELVHESLIKSWPALRRWLDENQEDASFLAQVRAAAQQWDAKGRVDGLLWRNEAMEEARLWRARSTRELPPKEDAFLSAVFALATRAQRTRRRVVVGAFAFLVALVAIAAVALIQIRDAEHRANDQAAKLAQSIDVIQTEQKAREAEHAKAELAEKGKREAAEAAQAAVQKELDKAQEVIALQAQTRELKKENQQVRQSVDRERQEKQLAAAKAAELEREKQKKLDEQKKRAGQISTGGLK
ncbi:MAG TPA: serine/threonine-protein kinase [Kofleriaceae bacterium]